jgi:hypothetical protein
MNARVAGAVALTAAGILSVSCTSVVDPSKNVTQTFTGTIAPQGQSVQAWSTGNSGEYTIKITSLMPTSSAFIGVILAQGLSDGTCSGNLPIIQSNPFATVNAPALSNAIIPGNYCVFVYDVGTFTTTQTYTMTVSHP